MSESIIAHTLTGRQASDGQYYTTTMLGRISITQIIAEVLAGGGSIEPLGIAFDGTPGIPCMVMSVFFIMSSDNPASKYFNRPVLKK